MPFDGEEESRYSEVQWEDDEEALVDLPPQIASVVLLLNLLASCASPERLSHSIDAKLQMVNALFLSENHDESIDLFYFSLYIS